MIHSSFHYLRSYSSFQSIIYYKYYRESLYIPNHHSWRRALRTPAPRIASHRKPDDVTDHHKKQHTHENLDRHQKTSNTCIATPPKNTPGSARSKLTLNKSIYTSHAADSGEKTANKTSNTVKNIPGNARSRSAHNRSSPHTQPVAEKKKR